MNFFDKHQLFLNNHDARDVEGKLGQQPLGAIPQNKWVPTPFWLGSWLRPLIPGASRQSSHRRLPLLAQGVDDFDTLTTVLVARDSLLSSEGRATTSAAILRMEPIGRILPRVHRSGDDSIAARVRRANSPLQDRWGRHSANPPREQAESPGDAKYGAFAGYGGTSSHGTQASTVVHNKPPKV